MCGIAGVLYNDTGRPVDIDVLRGMGAAIQHRGPDGQGTFRAGHVGLVHQRLSIIDLSGGHQPMANEDESIQVVFNGEIYNFMELRQDLAARGHQFRTNSDTEVLAHLFEEYGTDMCGHLRGMFAFAIWNARSRQLFLARDHLGQKPLFIYRDHEKLLFGSELKALFAHPAVNRQISSTAIEDYLTFGFIPGAASVLSHVQKLPPAHHVLIAAGNLHAAPVRYWDISYADTDELSDGEWCERVDEAIRDSVRHHLVSDVPVGAFLSGGLDSSAIVATVAEMQSDPVRTFSIGFQEKQFSELPYAEAVARHYGCRHTEEIVTPDAVEDLEALVFLYDEPFADTSAIPTMAVSRMAAQHVKVVLSGDGGDELFGGYARYSHDLKESRLRGMLPAWLRKSVLRQAAAIWPRADWLPRPMRLKSLLQNLSADPAVAYANTVSACRQELRGRLMNADFAATIRGYRPEAAIESAFQSGSSDPLSGMLAADTRTLLPDDFLTKVDRASMGYGLEVRPPLIDCKLMELAARMPSRMKIREGSRKWIMKQIFDARLPDKLAHRRKQGFEIPVDSWLRGPLRDQVEQVVTAPGSPLSQFVDPGFAGRLLDAHCRRQGRHGQLLWSLLVLGRWLDRWGNNGPTTIGPAQIAASVNLNSVSLIPQT